MANYKAQGIILKRTNFSEADRMLVIFTREFGKIKAIAKGVRKQNSRLGGNLELFCNTQLVLATGRNFDIITEAEIIESYLKTRKKLDLTHKAYYLAEVIDKLTVEHVEHPEIFNLFTSVIEKIGAENSDLLLPYFEINMLKNIGYEPELVKCQKCHTPVIAEGNKFDCEEGGLVCSNCQSLSDKVSADSIKILRIMLAGDISLIERIKLNKKQITEVTRIADNFIKHIHQDEFKSRRFLKD